MIAGELNEIQGDVRDALVPLEHTEVREQPNPG